MSDTDQSTEVRNIVRVTSIVSAALGVALSPIPLADELILIPVYGTMTAFIGKTHGLGMTQVPWRPIAAATVTGLGVRAALNVAFAFIPGVAAAANAISAAALTRLLAAYVDRACASPESVQPLSIQEITETLKRAVQRQPVSPSP
jgi:uncharacterized protein (DUF697 family)